MAAGATIESAMTPYPHSIEMDAHVSSAKSMPAQFGIRHLPVKQGPKLIGIISLRDIKRSEACGTDTSLNGDVRVEKIRDKDIYVVEPDVALVSVNRHMADHYIDSALVAHHGKLVGIFTFTDAFKRYAALLSGEKPGS